jgi:hypothetical protein
MLSLLFLLVACSSNTDVYTSTFHQSYDNGRSIEVVREDRVTKWKGLLTGTNYGETNNFDYSFTTEPDGYEWRGLTNQAPLALIFCGDETFLKVTERVVERDSLYGPVNLADKMFYFKNVDERYFFKLFGQQYFVASDSIQYQESLAKCGEVPVPYLK